MASSATAYSATMNAPSPAERSTPSTPPAATASLTKASLPKAKESLTSGCAAPIQPRSMSARADAVQVGPVRHPAQLTRRGEVLSPALSHHPGQRVGSLQPEDLDVLARPRHRHRPGPGTGPGTSAGPAAGRATREGGIWVVVMHPKLSVPTDSFGPRTGFSPELLQQFLTAS